jgi:hypothetical protein
MSCTVLESAEHPQTPWDAASGRTTTQVLDPGNMSKISAELQCIKVWSMNGEAFKDLAPDHGQALEHGGPDLRSLRYSTALEL